MEDDIRMATSKELCEEQIKERKKRYKEACMLIMEGIDKLAAAGSKLDSGTPELFKLIDARVMLSEPLARAQSECDFREWMYADWKKKQEEDAQHKK